MGAYNAASDTPMPAPEASLGAKLPLKSMAKTAQHPLLLQIRTGGLWLAHQPRSAGSTRINAFEALAKAA